jgi:hypothetical protein
MRNLEQEKLSVSNQIIEELSARLRARDKDFDKLRGFRDRVSSKERLRMSKMLDRGQLVMRVIQDDTINNAAAFSNQSVKYNPRLMSSRTIDNGTFSYV